MSDDDRTVEEVLMDGPTEDLQELEKALDDRVRLALDREDPLPPMSYNEAMVAIGGKTVGNISQEEAEPIIAEMMRNYLGVAQGEPFSFTEGDFLEAIMAMPMAEYAVKRAAIAAYRYPR